MAMTFCLPPALNDQILLEELRGKPLKWESDSVKFFPRIVKSGQVFEEVYQGKPELGGKVMGKWGHLFAR